VTKIAFRASLLVLLLSFLVACAPRQTGPSLSEKLDSWIGHHQSDLIRQWGAPTRVTSDGQGGAVLVYEFTRDLGCNAYRCYVGTEYIQFFVTSRGVIYHWKSHTY